MKKIFVIATALMAGCASQPTPAQRELVNYVQTVKPNAGTTVKWSDYYEGLYIRDQAAGASGETLLRVNDAIRIAKQYEAGQITKDEFDDKRRALSAGERMEQERQAAQEREAKTQRALALAAALNANNNSRDDAPAYKVAQPKQTTTNTTCNSFGGQVNCTSTSQ